ncbi:hypothetical protein [Candidatus Leptofilum sp.]|uniref:hypothetical protein n=1 Tax=Candidatus Leptofilum sp. TaxID=3241576 RepID=UPI003B5B1CCD
MKAKKCWLYIVLLILFIGCGGETEQIRSNQDLTIDVKNRHETTISFSLHEEFTLFYNEDGTLDEFINEQYRQQILDKLNEAQFYAESCYYQVSRPDPVGGSLYVLTATAINSTQGRFADTLECLGNFSDSLTFQPLKVDEGIIFDTYKLEVDLEIDNELYFSEPGVAIPVLKDFRRIRIVLPGSVQEVKTEPTAASDFFTLVNINWDSETNIVNWDYSKTDIVLWLTLIAYYENEIQQITDSDADLSSEEKADAIDDITLQIDQLEREIEIAVGRPYSEVRTAYDAMKIGTQNLDSIKIIFSSQVYKITFWEVIGILFGSGVIFSIIGLVRKRKSGSND